MQVRIIPIAEEHRPYAEELKKTFMDWNLRVEIDARDEKLGKRIRDAQLQKAPYMLVLGDKEMESRTVAVRERTKGDLGSMDLPAFRKLLSEEFNPIH